MSSLQTTQPTTVTMMSLYTNHFSSHRSKYKTHITNLLIAVLRDL